MAYNELIKNFENVRSYMRDFYIYGFKNREEYDTKSARSYDNERRRIESWLGEFMSFHQDASGKSIFISIDGRRILFNPLYKAWKAKSFTKNDISLHFLLLDILQTEEAMSIQEIVDALNDSYLSYFKNPASPDEATIRNKLREYCKLGMVASEKDGKKLKYKRVLDNIELETWIHAIAYFSEIDAVGVIGSFLLDKFETLPDYFSYKHHGLLFALDSGILLSLLRAIKDHKEVAFDISTRRESEPSRKIAVPIKILSGVQSGRRYLAGYDKKENRIELFRIDRITNVTIEDDVTDFEKYSELFQEFKKYLWGVSIRRDRRIEHIELKIHVEAHEDFIIQRLLQEQRCGTVTQVGETEYLFTADVYDATELLPWIRTFTGRIQELVCSNRHVAETLKADYEALDALYGGGSDVV